jgi:hypothetical protein
MQNNHMHLTTAQNAAWSASAASPRARAFAMSTVVCTAKKIRPTAKAGGPERGETL